MRFCKNCAHMHSEKYLDDYLEKCRDVCLYRPDSFRDYDPVSGYPLGDFVLCREKNRYCNCPDFEDKRPREYVPRPGPL